MIKKSSGKLRIIMWAVVFVIGIGLIGMAEAQFYMGEQGWGQGWATFPQYGIQGYYPPWGGMQYPAASPYQGYQAFGDGGYGGYNPAYQWSPATYGGSGYYSGNSGPSYFAGPLPGGLLPDGLVWDEWSMWGTVEERPHSWEQVYYSGHGGYGGYSHTPPDDLRIGTSGGSIEYFPLITVLKGETWDEAAFRLGLISSPEPHDRSLGSTEE